MKRVSAIATFLIGITIGLIIGRTVPWKERETDAPLAAYVKPETTRSDSEEVRTAGWCTKATYRVRECHELKRLKAWEVVVGRADQEDPIIFSVLSYGKLVEGDQVQIIGVEYSPTTNNPQGKLHVVK